jgi:ATP-dependent helicase IRC3
MQGDFVASSLSELVNTPERNQLLVEAWRQHAAGRKSTLIFAVDVQHSKDIAQTFNELGIPAYSVDGQTRADTRADILDRFRAGEIPVLVNCAVFTEGTDIPCIDCLIMARPTRSSVLYQQMVGRGLRLFGGKQDCLCIDMVDTMGRNAIITVPSLMGLSSEFDARGSILALSLDHTDVFRT